MFFCEEGSIGDNLLAGGVELPDGREGRGRGAIWAAIFAQGQREPAELVVRRVECRVDGDDVAAVFLKRRGRRQLRDPRVAPQELPDQHLLDRVTAAHLEGHDYGVAGVKLLRRTPSRLR